MMHRDARGIDDIPLMREFAARNYRDRGARAAWHPGDITWMMATHSHMNLFDNESDIQLWITDTGDCAGIAWFYNAFHLRFDALPGSGLDAEILEWGIGHCREINAGRSRLIMSTETQASDSVRRDVLAQAGFTPAGSAGGDILEVDLATLNTNHAPLHDSGFTVIDCASVSLHDRAQCHRDAWSSLGHIDRPDQVSQFHDQIYEGLRGMPGYDSTLDLIAVNPAGDMGACCIAWTDALSRYGIFEPVGTAPRFRGMGLAGLLIDEALARLAAQGMTRATVVSSEADNPTAYRTYRKTFNVIGRFEYVARSLR